MKETEKGLGCFVYTEWLIPVIKYFSSIRINEAIFEIGIPILASGFCIWLSSCFGNTVVILKKLNEILPTVISVLIGFTVMLITVLLTNDGNTVAKLKRSFINNKKMCNEKINLYQGLHIQFTYCLFTEICLLLLALLYLIVDSFACLQQCMLIYNIFLFVEIFLVLHILFSVLRGITNLYFSFYDK